VNAEGGVTYTPPAGFTGTDSFYQVSDGRAVAEGEVTVAVTEPAVPAFANGFRYCGSYNGSAVAVGSNPTWLGNQVALTVQALIRADAAMVGSNHGILAQGAMNGTDASAGLILQYLASSGTAPNVVHFKIRPATAHLTSCPRRARTGPADRCCTAFGARARHRTSTSTERVPRPPRPTRPDPEPPSPQPAAF
jgi:hypothetical protein